MVVRGMTQPNPAQLRIRITLHETGKFMAKQCKQAATRAMPEVGQASGGSMLVSALTCTCHLVFEDDGVKVIRWNVKQSVKL